MNPDIYIKVRFKTTIEGGRKTSLKRKTPLGPDFYACPMMVNGKVYDCRLLIGDMVIDLGKHYEIPVKFLDSESALKNLSIGNIIILLEGREVADGEVTKICSY
ncbi:MAG: hypothetical protein WCF65_04070 [Parachlamydiaceae bacterium]